MEYEDIWKEEIALIQSIIAKTPLIKTIKWGSEVFTYKDKNVVSYGAFKNYVAIWFYNGVFLKDPCQVLINAQDGKTKSLRQWRFESRSQINEQQILEYIQEAIENEEKGLKIKPDKFAPMTPPEWFQQILEQDPTLLNAFTKLTPGKQKEYILYIEEPKQEATKTKRLEKIIPMILAGQGLNDRYK